MKVFMSMVMVFLFFIGSTATAAEHGQKAQGGKQQASHSKGVQGGSQVGKGSIQQRHVNPGVSHARPPDISRGRVAEHHENINFRGRHYDHFNVHERTVWHGGAWRHTSHGWFWVVGGVYYSYPVPIYPWPLLVSSVVLEYPLVYPVVAVASTPTVVVRPPLVVEAQPQYWYYCDDPAGFAPYVQNCAGNKWQRVPTPPPQAPPPPAKQ